MQNETAEKVAKSKRIPVEKEVRKEAKMLRKSDTAAKADAKRLMLMRKGRKKRKAKNI